MNEVKQQFREHFKTGRSGRILMAILCVLALLLLAVWGILRQDPFRGEAQPFDPVNGEQEGKYVSLEVIGIDNWSAAKGEEYYYVAQGSDKLLYLVRMTQDDFESMQKQYEYWTSTGSDEATAEPIEPVPLELKGYSTAFPDQILETVAETYGDSVEDMANYLGEYYLDTNMAMRNRNYLILPVTAGICAVIALLIILSDRQKKKKLEKSMAALEQRGQLLNAWNEFSLHSSDDPKNDPILTDNYIFARNSGDIIPYRDIVWAYKHIIRRNFIEINSFVVCYMRDKTSHQLMPLRNKKRTNDMILSVIAERNPAVLLGYTKENRSRYKEMTQT